MLPFETLRKDLVRLKQGGINAIVQELVIENSVFVKNLNREKQLYEKGIDSLGNKLKPYTRYTVREEKRKGQPYDKTTLKDTGDFYKKFYIQLDNREFKLDSADVKRDELEEKYGTNGSVFGLTP